MKTLILLCLVALSSCGGGSSPAASASKDLFSSWAADSGNEVISLVGGTFAAGQSFGYQLTSGEACLCNAAIGGTQSNATAVLTGCAYIGGGGGVDPGCAALNRAYTMTNSAAKLTICGAVCTAYH